MALKLSNNALVVLCLTLSAALFFFGTGLFPAWQLTWLAAIPVLWLSPRLSAWMAFFVAAAAFAIGTLNEWYYLAVVVPLWVSLLYMLGPACIFGVAVLFYRGRVLRGKLWQAVLIVPAFWVVYEYVNSLLSIHGTIGNYGYSQMKFLPILQIASATGIWGISFSIFLFAAAAAALLGAGSLQQKLAPAVIAFVFLAFVFAYGFWRLATVPANSPSVKVGLIASDDGKMLFASNPQQSQYVFDQYGQEMKTLASQGVQVFVLPENSGPVTDASAPAADAAFEEMAKQTHAFIAIGVDRIEPKHDWNQARLYAPNGTLLTTYNKHHLLPHWEDHFTPSTSRSVVTEPSGTWGLQICKDLDFPRLSRQYSQDGVGLMIVPAWDFWLDGWSHGSIAIMRGVEDGFSVARSAKKSVLYAADDRGHVLGQQGTDFTPFATVVTTVPVRHDVTIYSRFGDWFAWLDIALLLALLGMPLIARD
jgi:apolipoprotein N-acyltransferase